MQRPVEYFRPLLLDLLDDPFGRDSIVSISQRSNWRPNSPAHRNILILSETAAA
jgi:hypothetical protein